MKKILHDSLKHMLEEWKYEIELDMEQNLHTCEENTTYFEVYMLDLGKYVSYLLTDIAINRGGSNAYLMIKYYYNSAEEYNERRPECNWITNDEYQAIKTFIYYFDKES